MRPRRSRDSRVVGRRANKTKCREFNFRGVQGSFRDESDGPGAGIGGERESPVCSCSRVQKGRTENKY